MDGLKSPLIHAIQVNIYSEAVMTESPGELRPQDGNFEKRWSVFGVFILSM